VTRSAFVFAVVPGVAAVAAFSEAPARAQVVAPAEPRASVDATVPSGAPPLEVQVTTQLVVDAKGRVESAVVVSRAPATAPASFDEAALAAVRASPFAPSTRDGRPFRSRVEYVVVFHPPPIAATPSPPVPGAPPAHRSPSSPVATTTEQDEDYAQVVQVRGAGWSSPRGLGDIRIKRELLEASPRQQTSEMLSAAPGFFVDHEDGEGLGNDVYLRGFDLDHGSGIEMRLGSIPINIPNHIQGQGYTDANFIIPEVVRSIRVLEGPYDPRQGDAAIVGSAYFDLGVPERGYLLKSTLGSFDQVRVVGVAAPAEADEETFAAFSIRSTNGFGESRASQSASVNSQYAVDLGPRDRMKVVATAYGARSLLPGVVREDDVDAGRVGYYDAYPSGPGYFAGGQSVQAARVILGADFDHVAPSGARFEFAPWFMWTDSRNRQNYTGALETSQIDPALSGLGDLFELTNRESAGGLTARFHTAPVRIGAMGEAAVEPGVFVRIGHTDQTKSLLDPNSLQVWDRRIDAGLDTTDIGAYVDFDLRLFKRLHISGGPRADMLLVSVDDRLANLVPAGSTPPVLTGAAVRDVQGIAAGPRITASYDLARELTPVVSYGEGFRSLDVQNLQEGAAPFSKVRSVEGGFRAQTPGDRYTTTLALFATWVGNELVFEPAAGGLETESASLRRGLVSSFIAKPWDWLLVSSALSITDATFSTLVVGTGHYVPNVPPILFRTDVTARAQIGTLGGKPVVGRVGAGYTFLSGRHLTDTIVGRASHVLNAKAAVRCGFVEVGVDAYNVLGLKYADDAEYYVSNWSLRPGQQQASEAIHITAAPPLTVLGNVSLYF
jgi:iron complex outermembrane recepter protein